MVPCRLLPTSKRAAAGLLLAGAATLSAAQAAPVSSSPDLAVTQDGIFQFAQMDGDRRKWIRRRGGGNDAMRGPRMGDRNFDRRGDNRRWAWDRGRHGPRYSYRRPGYGYYRDGYWYGSPWWLGAAAGALVGSAIVGSAAASSDEHVEYCLSRYRTYDPRTDTYIGSSGRRYRCVGP